MDYDDFVQEQTLPSGDRGVNAQLRSLQKPNPGSQKELMEHYWSRFFIRHRSDATHASNIMMDVAARAFGCNVVFVRSQRGSSGQPIQVWRDPYPTFMGTAFQSRTINLYFKAIGTVHHFDVLLSQSTTPFFLLSKPGKINRLLRRVKFNGSKFVALDPNIRPQTAVEAVCAILGKETAQCSEWLRKMLAEIAQAWWNEEACPVWPEHKAPRGQEAEWVRALYRQRLMRTPDNVALADRKERSAFVQQEYLRARQFLLLDCLTTFAHTSESALLAVRTLEYMTGNPIQCYSFQITRQASGKNKVQLRELYVPKTSAFPGKPTLWLVHIYGFFIPMRRQA